jgi:lysophospholipase L1-like esterase
VNAGVSGETSADLLARLDRSVPADADGALIAVGANDMLELLPPSDLAKNLRAMIERLHARSLRVALAGMRLPTFFAVRTSVSLMRSIRRWRASTMRRFIHFCLKA